MSDPTPTTPAPVPAVAPARARTRTKTDREPLVLEIAGVFLAVAGLRLASAIVTLAPDGSTRRLANVVGPTGRAIAEALTLSLGLGAYVLAAFPIAWGASCVQGHRPAAWGRKAAFAPILAFLVAVFAALLFKKLSLPGVWRSGPGGYLGIAVGQALFHVLGRAAGLVAFALVVTVALLSTDVRIGALIASLFSTAPREKRKSPADADASESVAVLEQPEGAVAVEDEEEVEEDDEDEEPVRGKSSKDDDEDESEDDEDEDEEREIEDDAGPQAGAPPPPR